jgi:anaerobic sulfite reductase subunit B
MTADLMTPLPYHVVDRRDETADTVTLSLSAVGDSMADWRPGQFTMVYAFGVGEIPLSVSGGESGLIHHTVREVGAVSRALCRAQIGTVLGVRGPYGAGWPAPPDGADVVVVAGGIGLAPLRPVIRAALARPHGASAGGIASARPGRLSVLIGARTPADLVFTNELDRWREAGAEVFVTVDRAESGWPGRVGLVTALLTVASFAPEHTVGYVCGPEVMMRLSAQALIDRGVPPARVSISLERNMRCGVALCGHCQLGPVLVCRDGPVVGYDVAARLFGVSEL